MQIRLSNIVFFSTLLLGGSSFCAAIEVKYGKGTKEGKTVALDTKFQKNDVPNFQKKGDREQAGSEFGTNIKLRTRRERGNVVIARQKKLKFEDIMEQEVDFVTVRRPYIYIYIYTIIINVISLCTVWRLHFLFL
jgi:hypothetical protein